MNKLAIQIGAITSALYFLIFILAHAYAPSLAYAHASQPNTPISPQSIRSNPQAEQGYIEVLAIELAFLSFLGYLEVKGKYISRALKYLLNQLIKTKEALFYLSIIFMAAGFGILNAATILSWNIAWYAGALMLFIGGVGLFSLLLGLLSKISQNNLGVAVIVSLPILILLDKYQGYESIAFYIVVIAIFYAFWAKFPKRLFNIYAIIMAIGFAMLIGLELTPWLMLGLLGLMSIYDYIAVFITKHMQLLARVALSQGLPVAIILGSETYLKKKLAGRKPKGITKAALLGGGDIILPGAVISSFLYSFSPLYAFASLLGAIGGIWLNMALLNTGRFKHGLPALPAITGMMLLCLGFAVIL